LNAAADAATANGSSSAIDASRTAAAATTALGIATVSGGASRWQPAGELALYLSDLPVGRISSSEFNNKEQDIGKLEIQSSNEAIWSEHLERQAMSGKRIAAFWRDEEISVGDFYPWSSKLRENPAELPVTQGSVTSMDLGAVTGAKVAMTFCFQND
jgi:hypothetical protein